jgi:uncharacterized transporter YbjL
MNKQENKKKESDKKEFNQSEKARKGWAFSVFFLLIVICMILFLSYVPLQADNRDIIVGMIGTITGSIGSMIAIAAGRDPAEIDELKEKLANANADRGALISRLRDAQIQMQLLREQQFELQNAIIKKLSIFANEKTIKTVDESQVMLHPQIEEWLPDEN